MAVGSYLIFIIYLIFPIVMLTSAIIAHRGRSFWATWLMLIGAILLLVGIIGMAGSLYLIIGQRGSSGLITTIIVGIGSIGGTFCYFIGIFGLCARWGPTARRAAELEELTKSLIAERSRNQG